MQKISRFAHAIYGITLSSLEMILLIVKNISVNKENCKQAMSEELYATEEAYRLVKDGMSFREAYKFVGRKYFVK